MLKDVAKVIFATILFGLSHALCAGDLGGPADKPVSEPSTRQSMLQTSSSAAAQSPIIKKCTACDELREFITLQCGHEQCKNCLYSLADAAIKCSEPALLHCTTCQTRFQLADIDPTRREAVNELLSKTYLAGQKCLHCPTPNCGYQFIEDQKLELITCPNCNQTSSYDNWHNSITDKWILEHTKLCPNCKTSIEKNGGCKHMTCTHCKHEFCWLCLGKWKGPEEHGGFYKTCPHDPKGGSVDPHEPVAHVYYDRDIIDFAHDGLLEPLQALLADGTNVNFQNYLGETALMMACRSGHLAIVQALLARPGIDLNIQDDLDETALMMACHSDHLAIVQALLAHGADVNIQGTHNGNTALIIACSSGHFAIVQALLARGADVNIHNPYSMTALMHACDRGHLAIIQALLAIPGINVNIQDNTGNTALMYASRMGHLGIVQALLALPNIRASLNMRMRTWLAQHRRPLMIATGATAAIGTGICLWKWFKK